METPPHCALAPHQQQQQQQRRSSHGRRDDAASSRHEEEQLLLHQTVMASKRQQIELQLERLAKQRAFIRHEKRKLLLQNALLESERERFDASLAANWFCSAAFPSARDRRVTIDVGGQLFELSSALAAKDAKSLLAALVDDDSPLAESDCGCFRVDRDWWLFRYVLVFLRDGVLPQHDPKLLRELYLESEFWKLESLRRAIEMRNMELLQVTQGADTVAAAAMTTASLLNQSSSNGTSTSTSNLLGLRASMKSNSIAGRTKGAGAVSALAQAPAKDPNAWWLDPPLWWGGATSDHTKSETAAPNDSDAAPGKGSAFASMLKKAQAKAKGESPATSSATAHANEYDAWWHSTTYKGVDYAQALSPNKKQTQQSQQADKRHEDATHSSLTPRAPLIVHSTWASSHRVADS